MLNQEEDKLASLKIKYSSFLFKTGGIVSYKKFFPVFIIILITVIASYFLLTKNKSANSSIIVEIPFKEKQYKLNYNASEYKYTRILDFEEDEDWQGEGRVDNDYVKEGRSSLALSVLDSQTVSTAVRKNIDLGSVNFFTMFVFLRGESNDLESVNLKFVDKTAKTEYRYPITLLQKGWNLVRIPKNKFNVLGVKEEVLKEKEGTKTAQKRSEVVQGEANRNRWSNIEEIGFDLKARPESRVTVYLDNLAGESSKDYLEDFITKDENISLGGIEEATHLRYIYINHFAATLKKIGMAKDYTFKANIYPQGRGRMGLFFRGNYSNGYGYYFYIGGVGTSSWQLTKLGPVEKKVDFSTLTQGEIANFSFEKNKPYGLKATMKGSKIKIEISVDNKNYNLLAETNDSQFSSGGIGISVNDNASALFDEIEFNQ